MQAGVPVSGVAAAGAAAAAAANNAHSLSPLLVGCVVYAIFLGVLSRMRSVLAWLVRSTHSRPEHAYPGLHSQHHHFL
jgi:hypothetical protein